MKDLHRWMTAVAAALMTTVLAGCGSEDAETTPAPVLNIYVYGPSDPIQTRSVSPVEGEKKVNTLQIWVYRSSDGSEIGTLSLSGDELDGLNQTDKGYYSMAVPADFAASPTAVDVYVMANVTNANCNQTFDRNITREVIDLASFGGGYYQYPVTGISPDGLPMSGVIRNRDITVHDDVLHLSGANLQLLRTVSKIRFVFSSSQQDNDNVYIDEVTLNGGVLPQMEYFFLNGGSYRVGTYHVADEKTMVTFSGTEAIKKNEDPLQYVYAGGDEQAYETLIDQAAESNKVTVAPIVYVRESDLPLKGTIKYHVDNEEAKKRQAPFSMQAQHFPRNHTWIVYAFYGSSSMEVNTVLVNDWENGGTGSHDLYNW